jgi:hypothetical protein
MRPCGGHDEIESSSEGGCQEIRGIQGLRGVEEGGTKCNRAHTQKQNKRRRAERGGTRPGALSPPRGGRLSTQYFTAMTVHSDVLRRAAAPDRPQRASASKPATRVGGAACDSFWAGGQRGHLICSCHAALREGGHAAFAHPPLAPPTGLPTATRTHKHAGSTVVSMYLSIYRCCLDRWWYKGVGPAHQRMEGSVEQPNQKASGTQPWEGFCRVQPPLISFLSLPPSAGHIPFPNAMLWRWCPHAEHLVARRGANVPSSVNSDSALGGCRPLPPMRFAG